MPVFRIWSCDRTTRKTVLCEADIDSLLQKGKLPKLLYCTVHLIPITGTSEFIDLEINLMISPKLPKNGVEVA